MIISKKLFKTRKGFTLIELIMIISVIGILSATAVPVYYNLQDQAQKATEDSVVGSVKAGIMNYQVQSIVQGRAPILPATLDSASRTLASAQNEFFDNVLRPGVYDSPWLKLSDTMYQSPLQNIYTYDPSSGVFSKSGSFSSITNNGQVYSAPVAVVANPYSTNNFAVSAGGLYTPWSGTPINFTFDFANAGNYKFDITAINNADHPAFTASLGEPERNGWTLPTGYTQFNVRVTIDGVAVSPVDFGIAASDTVFNSNSVTTFVGSGQHTVSLTWLNDEYVPASNQDANVQFQTILVQSQ